MKSYLWKSDQIAFFGDEMIYEGGYVQQMSAFTTEFLFSSPNNRLSSLFSKRHLYYLYICWKYIRSTTYKSGVVKVDYMIDKTY